jgi:hypothetical protein
MCLLLLYFLLGAIASLYVILRSAPAPSNPARHLTPAGRLEALFTIACALAAWPIILFWVCFFYRRER